MVRRTTSAQATEALGYSLARALRGGEVLALIGNLGTGKTTFTKGLARGLGVRETITSPTFVLMKVYRARHGSVRQFVHVDCYRVPGVELARIGLGDYLGAPDTVTAIEWADKLPPNLKPTVALSFTVGGEPSRRIIRAKSSALSKALVF